MYTTTTFCRSSSRATRTRLRGLASLLDSTLWTAVMVGGLYVIFWSVLS